MRITKALGLATGGTPLGTYKRLIEDWYKVGDLDFSSASTSLLTISP